MQQWGKFLVPPERVLPQELKAPTQVGDGNFRLSTGFLEYRPATSPPTNQKKATHTLQPSPQILLIKTSPPKPPGSLGGFAHKPPSLLAQSCNKPFSAPNSNISIRPHCASATGTCVWEHAGKGIAKGVWPIA